MANESTQSGKDAASKNPQQGGKQDSTKVAPVKTGTQAPKTGYQSGGKM